MQLVEQIAEQDPYCGVRSLELIISEELQPWVDRKERGKDDEADIADWIESRPDTKFYEGPWKPTQDKPAVDNK